MPSARTAARRLEREAKSLPWEDDLDNPRVVVKRQRPGWFVNSKVSVILCGYNQVRYLDDAVASALAQTHRDLEVVVVDNGSTDGSRELLARYADEPRVRLLLYPENEPVTKRLNAAIAQSTGEFISILYADDYYLPRKIERQLLAFSKLSPRYGVVYSPALRVDERGSRWEDETLRESGDVLKVMLGNKHGVISPISPLYRRECLTRMPFHEDVFMEAEGIFYRLAIHYWFHFLDEPLTVARGHASNAGKAVKRNAATSLVLIDKLLLEPGLPPEVHADVEALRCALLRTWGWIGIRVLSDPKWAQDCLLSALARQPKQIFYARTVGGLALSLLSPRAIHRLNRAVNAALRKETPAFIDDYR